jgi:hypothetical protein
MASPPRPQPAIKKNPAAIGSVTFPILELYPHSGGKPRASAAD